MPVWGRNRIRQRRTRFGHTPLFRRLSLDEVAVVVQRRLQQVAVALDRFVGVVRRRSTPHAPLLVPWVCHTEADGATPPRELRSEGIVPRRQLRRREVVRVEPISVGRDRGVPLVIETVNGRHAFGGPLRDDDPIRLRALARAGDHLLPRLAFAVGHRRLKRLPFAAHRHHSRLAVVVAVAVAVHHHPLLFGLPARGDMRVDDEPIRLSADPLALRDIVCVHLPPPLRRGRCRRRPCCRLAAAARRGGARCVRSLLVRRVCRVRRRRRLRARRRPLRAATLLAKALRYRLLHRRGVALRRRPRRRRRRRRRARAAAAAPAAATAAAAPPRARGAPASPPRAACAPPLAPPLAPPSRARLAP